VVFLALIRVACGRSEGSDAHPRRVYASVGGYLADLSATPNYLAELQGARLRGTNPGKREGCFAEWSDEAPLFARGEGPKNGNELVIWRALTLSGKTTLGRYLADFWTEIPPGPGALGFGNAEIEAVASHYRLVQRMPPPTAAPPGFRAILPGECVLGSLEEDDERVIGRFWIELPAVLHTKIALSPLADLPVALEARLAFNDAEVPEMPKGDSYQAQAPRYFEAQQHGYHKVTIVRIDRPKAVPPEAVHGQNYTLQVYWGSRISSDCSRPDVLQHGCF